MVSEKQDQATSKLKKVEKSSKTPKVSEETLVSRVHNETKSGAISKLFFSWLSPLVRLAKLRTLDMDDLPDIEPIIDVQRVTPLWKNRYSKAVTKKNSKIERIKRKNDDPATKTKAKLPKTQHPGLASLYFGDKLLWISVMILSLLNTTTTLMNPTFFTEFSKWAALYTYAPESLRPEFSEGVIYGVLLIITPFLSSFFQQLYTRTTVLLAVRTRAAIVGMVETSVMNSSSSLASDSSSGSICNLMFVDSGKIMHTTFFIPYLVVLPIQFIYALNKLKDVVGSTAANGAIYTYIGMVPVLLVIAMLLFKSFFAKMSLTDARVKTITSILKTLGLIKIMAMEEDFTERINEKREKEMANTKRVIVRRSMMIAVLSVGSILSTVIMFWIYVGDDNTITAEVAFPAISWLNVLRMPLMMLPTILAGLLDATVSFKRLAIFFALPKKAKYVHQKRSLEKGGVDIAANAEFRFPMSNLSELKKLTPEARKAARAAKKKEAEAKRAAKKRAKEAKKRGVAEAESAEPLVDCAESDASVNSEDVVIEKTEDKTTTEESEHTGDFKLSNIGLRVQGGECIIICGPVGCGKSALCSTLVNEMDPISDVYVGSPGRGEAPIHMNGSTSYASQSPWLMTGTVRENILFGLEMDKERYKHVTDICQLLPDFDQFADGDLTEIGEGGVMLSGGQKMRVALARCVYSRSDVCILDDPLAAVDAHVARALSELVINGFLREEGRTVIMVTHRLEFASTADRLCWMYNGEILQVGTVDEIKANTSLPGVEELIKMRTGVTSSTTSDLSSDDNENSSPLSKVGATGTGPKDSSRARAFSVSKTDEEQKDKKNKMAEEERERGSVALSTYKKWFQHTGGLGVWIILLITPIIYVGGSTFSSWWLAEWSSEPDAHSSDFYLNVYIAASFTAMIGMIILFLAWGLAGWRASRKMHRAMIDSLMRTRSRFFDITPLGRITSRVSKDIDSIDLELPLNTSSALQLVCAVLGVIVLMVTANYLLVLLVPVLFWIYIRLLDYYRPIGRDVKRLDSVARSPVNAHITECIGGLETIRSFHLTGFMKDRYRDRVNQSSSTSWIMFMAQRWVAIRLQLISTLVSAAAVGNALYSVDGTSQFTSLAISLLVISYSSQLSEQLSQLVTTLTNAEQSFNSAERTFHYIENLDYEAEWRTDEGKKAREDAIVERKRLGEQIEGTGEENDLKVPVWPSRGEIEFKNVYARYAEELDLVMHGLSMHIPAGSRVALVGRTGSSKSTTLNVLLRLIEHEKGTVEIDGVDISKLGLHDLRESLAVITQDPSLMQAPLRDILDPRGLHDDEEIWDALDIAQLKEFVSNQDNGLDMEISSGGSNLSGGQKQLVCLARALLMKSKVLCLDEATASIDGASDTKVQLALRKEFKDSTIVTVAHRLATIIDYDIVFCLDTGRVAESGSPLDLFRKENGMFRSMCEQADIDETAIIEAVEALNRLE